MENPQNLREALIKAYYTLDGVLEVLCPLAYAALFGASLISMAFAGPAADRYGTMRVLAVAFALAFAGLLGSMLAPSMATMLAVITTDAAV